MTDSIYYDRPNKNPGQGMFHFNSTVIGVILILAILLAGFVGLCSYVNGLEFVERGGAHLKASGYTFDKLSYVKDTEEYHGNWHRIHKLKAKNLRGPGCKDGDAYVYIAFNTHTYEEAMRDNELQSIEPIN